MSETPARRRARSLIAHGLVELYGHLFEVTPGTPEQEAVLERYTLFVGLLGGLYPVETLKGIHVAAEGETGTRLTESAPPLDALVHMATMVQKLVALDRPEPTEPPAARMEASTPDAGVLGDLHDARRGLTAGASALVRVAESLADPSIERETIRLALAEVVTAIGRIYPRAVADAAQAYALEQVEVARPSPGTKQRISGATVEIYAKAFVEQIEKYRDDAAPPAASEPSR